MRRLDAVLFDIDDTLFATTAFARNARRNAVRAMVAAGLERSEEEVSRELDEVIREFSSNYEHHYDKLLQRLVPEGFEDVNPALIVAAGVTAYHDTKFREIAPFDDVVPCLRALRAAGLKTGVVTHGWTLKQAEKLVRLGLVPHLDPDAIFISDQIGIAKPNPKLYTTALRELGIPAERALYVGDSPAHDVAPPKSLGMVAVWARRASKYTLEEHDVRPDYVVDDFRQLLELLRRDFGVEAPADVARGA